MQHRQKSIIELNIRRILREHRKGRWSYLTQWNCLMLSSLAGWDEAQFARPQEFIPERWLRHRPLGQIHPYASLPFSHGIRMCIGRRIMEQEACTLIARVGSDFNI